MDAWRGVGVAENVSCEAEKALVGLVSAAEAVHLLHPHLVGKRGFSRKMRASVQRFEVTGKYDEALRNYHAQYTSRCYSVTQKDPIYFSMLSQLTPPQGQKKCRQRWKWAHLEARNAE